MSQYISTFLGNLSFCLFVLTFPNFVLAESSPLDLAIQRKIEQMSLEEKVGQLFIVGFPQKTVTKDLEKFIRTHKPGAFLLFRRNIVSLEQVTKLNADLTRLSFENSQVPPLLAVDQEGGSVSRLPLFPSQPNALALGQTESPTLARNMGYQTGLFLREVGFNMNLAPVLDVVDPTSKSFIGVRSFGPNPQVVRDIGTAYSEGLLKARVIPTAKHFPGAGDLAADPHQKVAENTQTTETFKGRDLVPYQSFAKLGKPIAIMMSHYIYPHLDSSREPASFSKRIVTDLLRDDLQYQGLVLTDDLQMEGSKALLRPEVAALKALKAGADIVMLSWSFSDQGKAFSYVRSAVQKRDLSESELNSKLRRILHAKAYANSYRRDPNIPSMIAGSVLTSPMYLLLEEQIFEQNFNSALVATPSAPSDASPNSRKPGSLDKFCAIAPSSDFLSSYKKGRNTSDPTYHLRGNFKNSSVESWIKKSTCDLVVLAVTGPKTARLAQTLSPAVKSRMVVVNLATPRWMTGKKGFLKVVQLSFNHADSGKRVAQNLNKIIEDNKITYIEDPQALNAR